MTVDLASLYPAHLAHVTAAATAALARSGHDHLIVASGIERLKFLDDSPYPFVASPEFKWWLPLQRVANSWIVFTPGKKPVLIYHQPADYWHLAPADPSGYWVEHFDIRVIREAHDARREMPASLARAAILGEDNTAFADVVPNNPVAVYNTLAIARTVKTPYELGCLRAASALGVRAHRAAATAFREHRSEYAINAAYIAATGQTENELPYNNIVCLNAHGAVLHYQYKDTLAPEEHHSLLIDAGAQVHGYPCDITRTYGHGDPDFTHLLEALNTAQLALCDGARAGVHYPDLHLDAHRRIAQILGDQDIVKMDPSSMVEAGVTSVFYPHGLGHFLGLMVHDAGGFLKDASGELLPKPPGHPYLRLTRTLEANNVLTIEPGIYFIPMLLETLRGGAHRNAVNWDKVGHLAKFGGIRIEDNIVIRDGAPPENMTRDAQRAMAA